LFTLDCSQNLNMHSQLSESQAKAVAHYLATGDTGQSHWDWPGQNFMEVEINSRRILRDALVAAVLERVPTSAQMATSQLGDLVTLTRDKVAPMVSGLFALDERSIVMATLERSVIFLTPENIESLLRASSWLSSSWNLANMYLLERGAEPLSPDAPSLVGMSEETTCYLSLSYLGSQEREPFSDYLVHEAAHVFHNPRRCTIGRAETRNKQSLLNIDFRKRETFAYACEAYSRILSLASTPKLRREALQVHANGPLPGDSRMDQEEYLEILAAAVGPGNGWQRILKACAPSR
jgi:hypothetical protein